MTDLLKRFRLSSIPVLSILIGCSPGGGPSNDGAGGAVTIRPGEMREITTVDERYQSYNVEMAEVIGGNFWKPYDKEPTPKTAPSPGDADFEVGDPTASMFQYRPPVDLYDARLRKLASALGPAYVRVSGTWANSFYFHDSDDPAPSTPPEGFKGVLTRQQWKGVVDFSHAVDAKIMTSFAISQGVRNPEGVWTPAQARKLLDYSRSIGGEIAAAELFNEPTVATMGGAPAGYNAGNFAGDFDAFLKFVRKSAPGMLIAGPGSVGEGVNLLPASMATLKTEDLLSAEPRPLFDIFSYHFYGAASQRCAMLGEGATTSPEAALSDQWLSRTETAFDFYRKLRDQYQPGKPIWLTETAETACGGNPWASTFLDSFRYLNQLGTLAKRGASVVFHNTLAASDYGLIDQNTLMPRPNFWAAVLWNKLMGEQVYEAGEAPPGLRLYAHSMKNSPGGITVLAINTSDTDVSIRIFGDAEQYTLSSRELRSTNVELNGRELLLGANDSLPAIEGKGIRAGRVELPRTSITFFTFHGAATAE